MAELPHPASRRPVRREIVIPSAGPGGAGLALAALGAILLLWPMLLAGGPLVYFDTAAYLSDGAGIVARLADMLAGVTGAEGASGAAGGINAGEAAGRQVLRSVAYSPFAYLTAQTPLGLGLTAALQTTLVIWTVLVLLPAGVRVPLVPALAWTAAIGTLSTLPWFAAYVMPDSLGAAVVVAYAAALRRIDTLGPATLIALIAIASFGTAAHYGHLPLAAALAVLVLGWRALARRLTARAVVVCCLPLALPVLLNVASSQVALDEGSIAPKRLPILLARSLADGPAAWYLRDACPEAGYAMCEVFDEIPQDIASFLWSADGIRAATGDQLDRIRQEEAAVLIAAFRAYPVEQTRSLLGNAALQTVRIGTGELLPARAATEAGRLTQETADSVPALALFDLITPLFTGLTALWLAVRVLRRRVAREVLEPLAVVIAALLINAAIFGGLSAPVDRYQSRLAWLVPVLLAMSFLPGPPIMRRAQAD